MGTLLGPPPVEILTCVANASISISISFAASAFRDQNPAISAGTWTSLSLMLCSWVSREAWQSQVEGSTVPEVNKLDSFNTVRSCPMYGHATPGRSGFRSLLGWAIVISKVESRRSYVMQTCTPVELPLAAATNMVPVALPPSFSHSPTPTSRILALSISGAYSAADLQSSPKSTLKVLSSFKKADTWHCCPPTTSPFSSNSGNTELPLHSPVSSLGTLALVHVH
mmetsp:Transcript_38681/g.46844  ORF Transcript_38681/g.46844 Transcript_38681/m.46844 type:complete len:225 (-) Transcript_38681:175-849(-)